MSQLRFSIAVTCALLGSALGTARAGPPFDENAATEQPGAQTREQPAAAGDEEIEETKETKKTEPHRRYRVVASPVREPEMVALSGITLHQGFQDLYVQGLGPRLGKAGPVVGVFWSATFTYLTTLWPHELGHWARAREAGGRFVFDDVMPFFPATHVELPPGASDEDRALISVGGFEVNALMARRTELEFHRRGFAYSDELSHGLLQEFFFPIYAFLVIPRDPTSPTTWTATAGDPVHIVLPTWQRHSGRAPVRADGTVDPDLIRAYRETTWMSLAVPLLDPNTWQAMLGFFDAHERGHYATRDAWVLLGDREFGWTFGTRFAPSVLGYAVHWDHYVHVQDRLVVLSPHAGGPGKDVGLTLRLPNLMQTPELRVGVDVDVWDQAHDGVGTALTAEGEYTLRAGLGVFLRGGVKERGYLLGRALGSGGMILAGLSARLPTETAD